MKKLISQTLFMVLASVALTSCSKKSRQPVSNNQYQETTTSETRTENQVSIDNATVYFDFDKSDVRSQDEPTITSFGSSVPVGAPIIVEGHCDERGTREYNLALGERRANSVKNFMESNGFNGKIQTVSYGKDKPAVEGSDAESWAKNRRAVLLLDK